MTFYEYHSFSETCRKYSLPESTLYKHIKKLGIKGKAGDKLIPNSEITQVMGTTIAEKAFIVDPSETEKEAIEHRDQLYELLFMKGLIQLITLKYMATKKRWDLPSCKEPDKEICEKILTWTKKHY